MSSPTAKSESSYYRLLLPVFQVCWAYACLEDRHYRMPWGALSRGEWLVSLPDFFTVGSAAAVLIFPSSVPLFLFMCLCSAAGTIWAWPDLANDSILILAMNLYLLASVSRNPRNYMPELSSPALAFLGFTYVAAAFHKLNAGFFETNGSCVRHFVEPPQIFQHLGGWHFPALIIVIFAVFTLLLEGFFPILLYSKATRSITLLVGFLFHLCIALQIDTFSAAVFTIYILLLPPDALHAFLRWTGSEKGQRFKLVLRVCITAFLIFLYWQGHYGNYYPWFYKARLIWTVAVGFAGAAVLLRMINNRPHQYLPMPALKNPGVLVVLLLALTINSLGPFLGFRTTLAFAMFSNLKAQGASNHFLIPDRALRVFEEQDDVVTLLWTNIPTLHRAGVLRWEIPRMELARALDIERRRGNDKFSVFVRYHEKLDWVQARNPGIFEFRNYPFWKRLFFSYRAEPPLGTNVCLW